MAESVALYEDKFVDADHIRIKSYYFPFCDKRIEIGDAQVSFATDQGIAHSTEAWGMALNNGWAPDIGNSFLEALTIWAS